MKGFGCWLLAVGFWLLVFGYWSLAVGLWLLVFGCWSLAVGQEPKAKSQKPKAFPLNSSMSQIL